ncbi:MAG: FG-GAP repeat domain-containing protein [Candidatus Hodarchaeota archaeon]
MFHHKKGSFFVLLTIFLTLASFAFAQAEKNANLAVFSTLAQEEDQARINVEETIAKTIFSAWGAPRISLPGFQIYSIEIANISGNEELLVCDERGDITSFEIQTEDRTVWARNLRRGIDDADIVGFEMEAMDFNLDGFDDIILSSGDQGLSYHENLGNGTITSGETFYYAVTITTGDFDGNGSIDLFGLDFPSNGTIWWNSGGNITGFERVYKYPNAHQGAAPGFQSLSAGDIDQDGRDEVFIIGPSIDQSGYIYEYLENGSFVEKQDLGSIGHRSYSTFGDINGDGWQDLVLNDAFTNVFYFENLGNGTLGQKVRFASVSPAADMILTDLDGDSKDDLILFSVTSSQNEVMFFWTSYIPPDTSEAKSDELGLSSVFTVAIVAVPILLLAISQRKKEY